MRARPRPPVPAAVLALLLFPAAAGALGRDEFVGRSAQLIKSQKDLAVQGKDAEAEAALKELLDYMDSAAAAAAGQDPSSHAELKEAMRLMGAVAARSAQLGEQGLAARDRAGRWREGLAGAAPRWIRAVELGELKRYPPDGTWGGYFVGKLKSHRAMVEAAYELDLVSAEERAALYREAAAVNEAFFDRKLSAALDQIRADPSQEGAYKNPRVYLSALEDERREFPDMPVLGEDFLRSRLERFLAFLGGLGAPLEGELRKLEGYTDLQDKTAVELFEAAAREGKDAEAVSAYRRRRPECAAAPDRVAKAVCDLLLLRAEKPYLEAYGRWYGAQYGGAKGAKGEAGAQKGGLGGIKVRGADLLEDPKTAAIVEKLAAGGQAKEERRKASQDWLEARLKEVEQKARAGDASALKDAKLAREFAAEYAAGGLERAKAAERGANRALFERARDAADIPAMLKAAAYNIALGRDQDKLLLAELAKAVLDRYEEAARADDLDEMIRVAAFGQTGFVPAYAFPLQAGGGRFAEDLERVVAKRYEAALDKEDFPEMYKAVAFGATGFPNALSWPFTEARYADDVLAVNARRLAKAVSADSVPEAQAAYQLAADQRLAGRAKAAAQRKAAGAFLAKRGVSVADGLEAADARGEEAARAWEEQEKEGLAAYEVTPKGKVTGSPRGLPKVKGLPVDPPAAMLKGRKVAGFEETVNFRLNDHWGKVDTEYKWVHSQSVAVAGALQYDVVRVWYLEEGDDLLAEKPKTAADKSLSQDQYKRVPLDEPLEALLRRELDALVDRTATGPREERAAKTAATMASYHVLNEPERKAAAKAALRKFVQARDQAVAKDAAARLAGLAKEGQEVSIAKYDAAVAEAARALLLSKPEGLPSVLAAAGVDFQSIFAEQRRGLGRPESGGPGADLPLSVSAEEVKGWASEFEAALAKLEQDHGVKGLEVFAAKHEALITRWGELKRKSLKTYNITTMKEGEWLDNAYQGGSFKSSGRAEDKRISVQAGDPNIEMANWVDEALKRVLTREAAVLEAVVADIKSSFAVLLAAYYQSVAAFSHAYAARQNLKNIAKPPAPEAWTEPPKADSAERRADEVARRLWDIESQRRNADERLNQLGQHRGEVAYALKAAAGTPKELKALGPELAKAAKLVQRAANDSMRPIAITRELVGTALRWDVILNDSYPRGLKSLATMGDWGDYNPVGHFLSRSAAEEAADRKAAGQEGSDEETLTKLLAEVDDKDAALREFVVAVPKLREPLEERLAFEKRLAEYVREHDRAVERLRWQKEEATAAIARVKRRLKADPAIAAKIDLPEYAAAKKEIDDLERGVSAATRAEERRVEEAAAEERKASAACPLSRLQKTVVAQFKAYEAGDAGRFMESVSRDYHGFDRFGLGLDRGGLEKSIADDLRNLKQIQFDVTVDAPTQQVQFIVPMTWAIRARLGASGTEWIAKSQRSTLRYSCHPAPPAAPARPSGPPAFPSGPPPAGPPGFPSGPPPPPAPPAYAAEGPVPEPPFLLESIEGENIFGRSNYAGVTVVDRGAVDGQAVSAPTAVLNGNLTADTSLLVGFPGVAGTPNSTVGGAVGVTGLSPSGAFVGSQTQLTVTGSGFAAGASLAAEFAPGSPNACAFKVTGLNVAGPTQLTLTLTLDPDALGIGGPRPAAGDLKVTNGNGAAATLASAFSVTTPKLTSLTPSNITFASSAAVTVNGADLRAGLTYGLISTDPATTVTNVTRVSDTALTARLDGMSAAGRFSLFLYETGTPPVCSPLNAQGGVTLRGAGRVDYTVNP